MPKRIEKTPAQVERAKDLLEDSKVLCADLKLVLADSERIRKKIADNVKRQLKISDGKK